MSQQLLPPDIRRLVASLETRVSALERRLQFGLSAPSDDEIIFTLPGTLAATESPPVRIRGGAVVSSVAVNLGTAGSTTTTIEVRRDGVAVGAVQLASGVTETKFPLGARFGSDQERLTVAVTTVGTGARNLTVQVRTS